MVSTATNSVLFLVIRGGGGGDLTACVLQMTSADYIYLDKNNVHTRRGIVVATHSTLALICTDHHC